MQLSPLKDQLKKILIALPGIIGSVINSVLKAAGSVAVHLDEHLWVFALAIGRILYTYVTEIYENKKRK